MQQQFEKGDEITYLDYRIKYCTNGDGIVLFKHHETWGVKDYEMHLGNFKDLVSAKRYAVIHYMIARPERFATHVAHYITGTGTTHEYDALTISFTVDGIVTPDDITLFDPVNRLIAVCGESLFFNKTIVVDSLINQSTNQKIKMQKLIEAMNETTFKFKSLLKDIEQ